MSFATLNEAFGNMNPNPNNSRNNISNRSNSKKGKNNNKSKRGQRNHRVQENFFNYESEESYDSEMDDMVENFTEEYSNNAKGNNSKDKSITDSDSKLTKMQEQIDAILKKLDTNNNIQNTLFNKNMHDIILFIIFGLFVVLLLEALFKIANNKKS
jgi:hypothetical protein